MVREVSEVTLCVQRVHLEERGLGVIAVKLDTTADEVNSES